MAWNQKLATILAFIAIILAGSSYMTDNWKKIEAENNKFAQDCNDRGGKAEFGNNVRQCIGAKIPSKQTASK